MAKRYSGRAVVTVVFDDRTDEYKASISVGGKVKARGRVGEPSSRTVSVDSPIAYDNAARAALNFALDDGKISDDVVAFNDRGVHIGRSMAAKWPKQENPSRKRAHKAPKRTKAQRSASARKGARTRARNAGKRR